MPLSIGELLFPPACSGCGELLEWNGLFAPEAPVPLCPECRAKWEAAKEEVCGICNRPVSGCACLTEEQKKARCLDFRKLAYYRHGNREEIANRLIYRIKDHPNRRVAAFLAEELSVLIREMLTERELSPDETVLTYLPRSRGALLSVGTDQAKALAEEISRISGIPVFPLIRRRFGHGKQQKKLSYPERVKNAKQSFLATGRTEGKGKYAILIDDIVTSGAGMAACARLLRKSGSRGVLCVAVASDDANREPPTVQPNLKSEYDRVFF